MKIALMLTGHTRKYRDNFPFLCNSLLQYHDVDIYCCTWSKTQTSINQEQVNIDKNYYQIYQPYLKNNLVLNADNYEKTKPHLIVGDKLQFNARAVQHLNMGWHERLYDQWYLVKKCWESISNMDSYKIIFRCRFDIALSSAKIRSTDGIVIPKDMGGWNFSDHLAYGSPAAMKKYCSVVDHIQDLYDIHSVDISHATDMLKFYMESYGTPVNCSIDESIRYTINK